MKEEKETLIKKMEAAEENAKKQIQAAEKERVHLEKTIKDLEETVDKLNTLLSEFKRPEGATSKLTPSVMDVGEPSRPPSGWPGITKDPQLDDLKIFPAGQKSPTRFIPRDQPLKMEMVIDFTDVLPAAHPATECGVVVYAKPLGGHSLLKLTESKFPIKPDKSPVSVDAKALQAGHYRLEAELTLHRPGETGKPSLSPPPAFSLNGGKIRVY
jgi:hypothetical protein